MFPLQATYSCQPLPLANHRFARERLYRLRVLWAGPTPEWSSAFLLVVSVPPTCICPWWTRPMHRLLQEPSGSPKFLTFLSTHATLFVDPGRPSGASPTRCLCVGFWFVNTIAICISLYNGAVSRLQGVRSPLWPTWFPVYASVVSIGRKHLLDNCNTRYGWLVRPYPAGTFTLQETPSLLGALTYPAFTTPAISIIDKPLTLGPKTQHSHCR